jgi:hypothetical protein
MLKIVRDSSSSLEEGLKNMGIPDNILVEEMGWKCLLDEPDVRTSRLL